MAKAPHGRPVAPAVDPLEPQGEPETNLPGGDHVTRTQDPETLVQKDREAAPDAEPLTQNEQSPVLTKDDERAALPGNGADESITEVKVKTKDKAHLLMDPFSGAHVGHDAVTVPVTTWINDELAEGGRLEKA